MIEINLFEAAGIVRPLFKETTSEGAQLISALNNHHQALALVDRVDSPEWCILRSSRFECTFIGGKINPDALTKAVQSLQQTGQILLVLADLRLLSFLYSAISI